MKSARQTTPFGTYVGRMRGSTRSTSRAPLSAVAGVFCAAFVGIYVISLPSLWPGWPLSTKLFLIGSFGASAALLYAAPRSEFAQPRNLLLGQIIAGVTGVTAYKLVGSHIGLAAALAVASAIAIMQVTGTLHPPAGATALIVVLGPGKVHHLGYEYVLSPVLLGAAILLVVALLVNNLSASESRHYPVTWW